MPLSEPPEPRRRNPASTRIKILEAAKTILAEDGAEALSVSRVAHLAGVNRGTAYQHFSLKEDLIRATLDWVSQQLVDAVFEVPIAELERSMEEASIQTIIQSIAEFNMRLAEYAIENPDIGRIWLFDVLSKQNPKEDVFYQRFERALIQLANSDASEENIDIEALAVLMLTGYFLWPVWVRSHTKTKQGRKKMAKRFAGEVLRLTMHGVLNAKSHAILDSYF